VYYEAGKPGRTAGRGTVVDDMIRLAGGVNVAGEAPLANPVLSSEAIVAADPEVIVLSPWSDSPEEVAQRPGWDRTTAVRTGRVHRVPERERALQYPSPACVEGCASMLVPWLHPELAARPAGER
jgi:iron complex transport system substrate-binding protein